MKTAEYVAAAKDQIRQATELHDKYTAEDREPTAEEKAAIDGHFAEARRLKDEATGSKDRDDLLSAIDAIGAVAGSEEVITEQDVSGLNRLGKSRKSWGRNYTESGTWKDLQKSNPTNRPDYWSGIHVQTPAVPLEAKAIITSGDTGGGPLIAPDERGLVDMGPFMRPMTVRDLISNGQTTSDTIRYARVTGFTNAATGVHEASTATGTNAAGGLKPQSDLATEDKTATVVTIAHWFAASKQSLSDAPFMRTLIDNYGRYGLEEEEEDQIIAGTGAANDQLEGFSTVSGVQTQVFATDIFTSVRKAITKVRKIGQARPNGVLVNLEDDEAIDLYRFDQGGGAGTGAWVGAGPFQTGPATLWGLPRVATAAVPADTAYVADFRTILFLLREAPSMRMTDSHADYFVRNLVALLFEERATQLVFRPKAICEVTTTA